MYLYYFIIVIKMDNCINILYEFYLFIVYYQDL